MFVNWQLVDPKGALNMKHSKGKLVNIPVPWKYASQDMLNF